MTRVSCVLISFHFPHSIRTLSFSIYSIFAKNIFHRFMNKKRKQNISVFFVLFFAIKWNRFAVNRFNKIKSENKKCWFGNQNKHLFIAVALIRTHSINILNTFAKEHCVLFVFLSKIFDSNVHLFPAHISSHKIEIKKQKKKIHNFEIDEPNNNYNVLASQRLWRSLNVRKSHCITTSQQNWNEIR